MFNPVTNALKAKVLLLLCNIELFLGTVHVTEVHVVDVYM